MEKQPLEKSIVTRILKYLNSLPDCRAIKVLGNAARSGEPDILACYRGRMLQLECKRPGGKATPLQLAVLDKWKKSGAVTAVVYSLEQAKEIVKTLS